MSQPKKSFVGHAAIYGFGAAAMQLASIVLLPLYTQYLTPGDFGVLEILSRTGQVICIVLMVRSIGAVTSTFYCQAHTPEQRSRAASTVSALVAAVVGAAVAAVVLFADGLSGFIGVDDSSLTVLGMCAALAECFTTVPMALMQAREQSLHYVVATMASFLFRLAAVCGAVAWLDMGVRGVLWASLATSLAIGAALNLAEFWRQRFVPDLAVARRIVKFALPFLPGGLCFFVLSSSDRYFLAKTAGQTELGIYALAHKLAAAVSLFGFTPFFSVWSVRMYDEFARPDAARRAGRMCTRLLAIFVAVGLLLCVFVDDIIAILASPDYAPAADLCPPLVLASLFWTAAVLMDGPFYVFRRTGAKPWINLLGMIVACGLNALLAPRLGPMGAATAAVAAFASIAASTWFLSQRVFAVAYEYGRLGAILASATIVWLLTTQIRLGIAGAPLKALLLAAWIAFLLLAKIIDDEEQSLIRGYLQRAWTRARTFCSWPNHSVDREHERRRAQRPALDETASAALGKDA